MAKTMGVLGPAGTHSEAAAVYLQKHIAEEYRLRLYGDIFDCLQAVEAGEVDTALVPVENSLLLFAALRKANVSTEMHIYPEGQHGLALGDDSTSPKDGSMVCGCVQSWIDLLEIWLKEMDCKISEKRVQ